MKKKKEETVEKKVRIKKLDIERQRILIEFESFQIVGWFGNFMVQEIDGHYTWNGEDYDWIVRPGEIKFVSTAYEGSLYAALEYIKSNLWEKLKIGVPEDDVENVIEDFEELYVVAKSIENRMEEFRHNVVTVLTDEEKLKFPNKVTSSHGTAVLQK